jgi:uncharacterized repeat protein (TIGR03803 family)
MSAIHWKYDLLVDLDTGKDWAGDAGPSTVDGAIPSASPAVANTAFATDIPKSKNPKMATLVMFSGDDGETPLGGLIADAAGDLFGTTSAGGTDGDGVVFEIAKTKTGYASAPTILASFTGGDGANPYGSLIADAAGDLFGTTTIEGAHNQGTVFEIARTKSGYARAPVTLVSFTGPDGANPVDGLIADAAGDLFGTTTAGGADDDGTVFEIARTKTGYASAPTVLVSFTGADGQDPLGGLMADAAGDLFGTTSGYGGSGYGTVFEIAKTRHGYANTPTVLASFTNVDGANPGAGLIADAAGDLFGTTDAGGADDDGVVFEIARTKNGYASAPTVLVSFMGADGENPGAGLIADAAGDLFGTTTFGGADGDGVVFEIARTKGGYAKAPTVLVSFTGANGADPSGSLLADVAGDLFGTTSGYGSNDGTVFEITRTRNGYAFVSSAASVTPAAVTGPHAPPPGAAFVQAMAGHGASGLGSGGPEILASRYDRPMLLSRPHAAC